MFQTFGITERGDAGLDHSWLAKAHLHAGVIAITKACQRLPKELPNNVIIHCTITGFGNTPIEPNVEAPPIVWDAYRRLFETYGPERVVLRVDPIIPTDGGVYIASGTLSNALGRVRISFLDAYQHVRERLVCYGKNAIDWEGLHAPLERRMRILNSLQSITKSQIEICGEPSMECIGCISLRDIKAIGLSPEGFNFNKCAQRGTCNCIASKVELLNNRKKCPHGCLYCYWKG